MFVMTPRRRRVLGSFAALVTFVAAFVVTEPLVARAEVRLAGQQAPSGARIAGDGSTEPDVPLLQVPGVDLVALGYEGVVLEAGDLASFTEALPDDPVLRVVELTDRIEQLPSRLDGLVEAQTLLGVAVAELDPAVGRRRSAVAVAELVERDAVRRRAQAKDALVQRKQRQADHEAQMVEVAVAAYVRPPDADVLASVLGGVATTNADLTAGVLFEAKSDHDGAVADGIEVSLAVAGERLVSAVITADEAAARAAQARAALVEAETARDAHREALSTVELSLLVLAPVLDDMREDLEATVATTWAAAIGDPAIVDLAAVPVVDVRGIRVHAAIAGRLQAMLAAAYADGVPLGGWGHRSHERQIALRAAHCGPAPEDIYLKPAGACSPPTAQPGQSLHERGLAIDFHLAGAGITTRDSPGYQWLAANAANYGFFNLPSEPWHWSVNGS